MYHTIVLNLAHEPESRCPGIDQSTTEIRTLTSLPDIFTCRDPGASS